MTGGVLGSTSRRERGANDGCAVKVELLIAANDRKQRFIVRFSAAPTRNEECNDVVIMTMNVFDLCMLCTHVRTCRRCLGGFSH